MHLLYSSIKSSSVLICSYCFLLRRKAFPLHCQEGISWPEPRMARERVEPTSFPYLNALTWRRTAYKVRQLVFCHSLFPVNVRKLTLDSRLISKSPIKRIGTKAGWNVAKMSDWGKKSRYLPLLIMHSGFCCTSVTPSHWLYVKLKQLVYTLKIFWWSISNLFKYIFKQKC